MIFALDFVLREATAACVVVRLVIRHYFSTHSSHYVLTLEHDCVNPEMLNTRIKNNS